MFIFSFSGVSSSKNNKDVTFNDTLPALCLAYMTQITDEIGQHEALNEREHLPILLAIMAQESGCDATQTPDVFQASESLGLPPNSLDTERSIKQGVKYFGEQIELLHEKELNDTKIAVQSYNYGSGFIHYMREKNAEQYTQSLSDAFEEQQGGNYGDSHYVEHVYRFLDVTDPIMTEGAFEVLPLVSQNIRLLQVYGQYDDGGAHYGIDISGGYGTIVVSVASGTVVMVHGGFCPDGEGLYTSCGGGYGNAVTIKHENGMYTRYGHMAPGSLAVTEGQQVKAGDRLGLEGNSGSSTAVHLHFEVRVADGFIKSDTRDPHQYITIPYTNR